MPITAANAREFQARSTAAKRGFRDAVKAESLQPVIAKEVHAQLTALPKEQAQFSIKALGESVRLLIAHQVFRHVQCISGIKQMYPAKLAGKDGIVATLATIAQTAERVFGWSAGDGALVNVQVIGTVNVTDLKAEPKAIESSCNTVAIPPTQQP